MRRFRVHARGMLFVMALLFSQLGISPMLTNKAHAAVTAYEAEASGNTKAGGASTVACSTCSGGNKVGNIGYAGTLQFNNVNGNSTGGSAVLTISYLAGDSTRSAVINVNGSDVSTVNFVSTGSWNTVGTVNVTISLAASSSNTIKLYNANGYAPDIDKITLSTSNTYQYNQTSVTDTDTSTTIQNGSIKIVYDKLTGLSGFYWNNAKKSSNVYSEVATTATFKSKDYTSHTFSTSDAAVFQDGHGTGVRITFVNSASAKPTIRQNFYIYDGKPYFFMDENVTSSTSISTNYIAPIKSDSGAISLNTSTNKQILLVPFDNDAWVRYNAKTVNGSGNSYEVTAAYDNDSRNGLIIGSITHDVWKTGIWYYGTGNNVEQLQVYGGAADSNTHDVEPHGSLSGTSIWSPKIFVGYYADWRNGLEEFGNVNVVQNGKLTWNSGVPFGYNSWGSVQSNLSYSVGVDTSDWIKNNLQNNNFVNNNTVYINLDSYWDNLTDQQLTDFTTHVHANGQKAGIYIAPYTFWGTNMSQQVEGSTYTYGDIVLKKSNGTAWGQLDGAYPLDPTHPGTKQRINYYIDKFKAKGYDYVKLDFLTHGSLEGQHYDSTIKSGMQAYNQGMAYIRDRIGGTMFISESIAPIFPSQYAHARRISCDTYGAISEVEYVQNSLSYGWWQNGTIYTYTDPDHMVLNSNIEEARSRVNSAVIGGTVFLLGNNVLDSSQQQSPLTLLTNSNINNVARKGKAFRAIEGNTGTSAADSFVLNDNGIYYLALFNYSSSSSKSMTVNLARAGLNGSTSYTVTDLWSGTTSLVSGTLSVTLNPYQSKLLKLN